jgi:sRNA-binding protein
METAQSQSLKTAIESIKPHDVTIISQMLDEKIKAIRAEQRGSLKVGNRVKVYTQTNEIHATLLSMASVQATVRLDDRSEMKVDLATLERAE